ncbi:MAG: VWA domain-containing protein [Chlorobiaceae bacterium]|jgi:Ca-activated chloride channel homolog|nr:VWA domain-containing protein [Chlorobiaceae bacterium]NTW62509.1 VWA domain-containing protein [Chlorobiaceae bacterium]
MNMPMQKWFSDIPRLEFAEPLWFLLLPVLAFVFWLYLWREGTGRHAALVFPGEERLREQGFEASVFLHRLPFFLRAAVLLLSVFAMAQPSVVQRKTVAETRGIDLLLVLDVSRSMHQKDFNGESRLEAVKGVGKRFVLSRSADRIGLVVFSGKGYTPCPLTLDHLTLGTVIDNISSEVIQEEGTAIGTAILIAVNRLRTSESRQKAIILLTDGENNAGDIDPLTAAGFALRDGIRIYTIAATAQDARLSDRSADSFFSAGAALSGSPAEDVLSAIARLTDGRSFRVGDKAGLAETFDDIDRLEKSSLRSPVSQRKFVLFDKLLLSALCLFVLELVMTSTRLIRIP